MSEEAPAGRITVDWLLASMFRRLKDCVMPADASRASTGGGGMFDAIVSKVKMFLEGRVLEGIEWEGR